MAPNVANPGVPRDTRSAVLLPMLQKHGLRRNVGSELRSMASYACFSVSNTAPSRHYAAYSAMLIAAGREPALFAGWYQLPPADEGRPPSAPTRPGQDSTTLPSGTA